MQGKPTLLSKCTRRPHPCRCVNSDRLQPDVVVESPSCSLKRGPMNVDHTLQLYGWIVRGLLKQAEVLYAGK